MRVFEHWHVCTYTPVIICGRAGSALTTFITLYTHTHTQLQLQLFCSARKQACAPARCLTKNLFVDGRARALEHRRNAAQRSWDMAATN